MHLRHLLLTGAAVLTTLVTYAQTPAPQAEKHRLTRQQRDARRAEHKAKLAAMSPAERQAFKQAHRERREAKLAAMTPEQRERVLERHRQRKEHRKGSRG